MIEMQSRYWNTMTQYKFNLCYYSRHYNSCILINRCITIILAVFSSGAMATWIVEEKIGFFCGLIIVLMQVLSVVNEFLPYKKRIQDLSEMITKLSSIYDDMESKWFTVASGEIENKEINELLYSYKKKWSNTTNKYLVVDSLPENEKIVLKANEDKEKYFYNMFSGDGTYANTESETIEQHV